MVKRTFKDLRRQHPTFFTPWNTGCNSTGELQHPASDIEHSTFNIQHPISDVEHPTAQAQSAGWVKEDPACGLVFAGRE
jgi:hypothetical protein